MRTWVKKKEITQKKAALPNAALSLLFKDA